MNKFIFCAWIILLLSPLARVLKLFNTYIGKESPLSLESSKPSWSWTCVNHWCVRSHEPNNSTSIQSWKTCNMICTDIPIWPKPTYTKLSRIIVPLDISRFNLTINSPPQVVPYLRKAFELMLKDVKRTGGIYRKKKLDVKNAKGLIVDVRVLNNDPLLRLSTNESYDLHIVPAINNLVAFLSADTYCGARHGLETLSQLIWYDKFKKAIVTFKQADIQDSPKFRYRGLLLDTARNYFPVEDILRTLDAMAASKLNTFHWHATDSQSFPLKFDSIPYFAWYGAYSPKEVYTSEDIKTIVDRARLRGIRVVIEVDTPAHVGRAWSWGKQLGLGNLADCIEAKPWKYYCDEPPCGQLNLYNPNVYVLLEKIYTEILKLTGVDDVFHLGGDEISYRCWGKKDNSTWLTYLQKTTIALQRANNGSFPELTILWSSNFINKDFYKQLINFTIQLWGGSDWDSIISIPYAGLKTIVSNVDAWYLDCGFGSWRLDKQGTCKYANEFTIYAHAPWKGTPWKAEGGEVCLWSELVSRGSLDAKLWPRAAAAAERLWSDPQENMLPKTILRLDMHRRRLVERGIKANVMGPKWCMDAPYACFDSFSRFGIGVRNKA